ncbi:MAG: hypothetical protein CM15mP120_21500 [Pseudomonadota bacterium]|nr:MAG: hypothetical protein CM15mP120_21500 [Pseudomonadota bacterium]
MVFWSQARLLHGSGNREASLSVEINEYLDALWLQRGLSENTLAAYRRDLAQTEQWLINNKRSNRLIDASADDLGAFNATRSDKA